MNPADLPDLQLFVDEYPTFSPDDYTIPDGCSLLIAGNHTLLLDLDTEQQVQQFVRNLVMVQRHYGLLSLSIWPSRGGNVHAVVNMVKAVPREGRLLLQLVLGSDPTRDFLHYGQGGDICLFKPLDWKYKVYGRELYDIFCPLYIGGEEDATGVPF